MSLGNERRGVRAVLRLALTLVACTTAVSALAQSRVINDSGQGLCTRNGSLVTRCAGTGQDGEFGRDVTLPDPVDGNRGFSFARICRSGQIAGEGTCPEMPVRGPGSDDWGCTLDRVTGLIWELKEADGGSRDWQATYTNLRPGNGSYGGITDAAGYVSAVNATGLCGASDWRLPTRTELIGVLDFGIALPGPLMPATWFPNVLSRQYWTADGTGASGPDAYYVKLYSGEFYPGARVTRYPVMLVRDPQAVPTPRFVPSADGTEVTDTSTGLVWRRCVEGMSWSGTNCTGQPRRVDWARAMSNARSAGAPWRMPNVKELASLVDPARPSPKIDGVTFPGTPGESHWTSTPSTTDPYYVWAVQFRDGRVTNQSHPNTFYKRAYRLVRDAP